LGVSQLEHLSQRLEVVSASTGCRQHTETRRFKMGCCQRDPFGGEFCKQSFPGFCRCLRSAVQGIVDVRICKLQNAGHQGISQQHHLFAAT
jgi:hypothetical protein